MAQSSLIYITGMPGSGKSTVCDELKRRGHVAYDTDNDSIAFFYNNVTGKAIKRHIPAADRTPEWRAQYAWKAKRETVEGLLADTEGATIFLCGVTANDVDELWDLFAKVFALVIGDEQALRTRIANRREDGYGKNPHELAALLEWQRTAAADFEELGAILVDATEPLEKVVDTILAQAAPGSPN
ncbi:MAG TPA: AAA family ATPase [Trebonia sp.]|nr:AAA family ATPase [Trebonia sp.]